MLRVGKRIRRMLPPVIIIAITVIMSIAAYGNILRLEEARCWSTLENTAATINNEIAVRFKDNITILKLASNAMVQENRVESYEAITKHLNAFQHMTIFNRIDVIYPDDTILLQSGALAKLDGDQTFAKIAEQGEHMSKRMMDAQSGNEVIYYAVPVVSREETKAILAGVIDCRSMPELFQTRAYGGQAFSCIVDYRDGSFIMDDWHDKLGNMYEMKPREQLPGYETVDLISDVQAAKTGVTAYKSAENGRKSYMYYTPAGIFSWELLIVVQEQVAFSSLLKLKSTLLLLGIVEAILLLLYFIWTFCMVNQLEKSKKEVEEKQKAFEALSFNDTMTKLYNRNKYNQVVDAYQKRSIENMGVAFFDLNCLKQVNDERGHKVGDILLQNTAEHIRTVFPDETFRIGGDEFVALAKDMDESTFCQKIEAVRRLFQESGISISIGGAWKQTCSDLNLLLKEADEKMYEEKRQYYENAGRSHDRRGRRFL